MFPYLDGLALRRVDAQHAAVVARSTTSSSRRRSRPSRSCTPRSTLAQGAPGEGSTPAPLAALAPRKELRRDVLGELELQICSRPSCPTDVAEKAAAGWGGDRLVAYADPADARRAATVVDLSAWDTETDAKEAEAVGAGACMQKLADAGARHTTTWVGRARRRQAALVFGAPNGTGRAVVAEVLKAWKAHAPPAHPTR